MIGDLFRRIAYLTQRHRHARELQDEMEFHREMASSEGRRNFGNTLRLREQAREAWGWTWIDRLGQDLSFAWRMLMRTPGFTLTAVLILTVGVGINVAAFSLFNLSVLQYLPVRDADRIVRLQRRAPDASTNVISYPSLAFYRDHAKSLSAVIGSMGTRAIIEDDADTRSIEFVTENYFSELSEQPAYGRFLDPVIDAAPGAPAVAVLGYGYWQQRFGGDPAMVGRTIRVNNKPVTVVGVESQEFASLGGHHLSVSLPLSQLPYVIEGSIALTDSAQGTMEMWGRLAPGVTAAAAQGELRALTNELSKQHPTEHWQHEFIQCDAGGHVHVMRHDDLVAVGLMGTLVILILVVACANLGGLLLARGMRREHEMSIRIAVGANRLRIFRQLFTESLLLAALGSGAGLLLGYIVLRIGLAKMEAPGWMSATPDWRILLFSLAMTLLTAIFFGLAPAMQIARQQHRRTQIRQALVAAQVAASAVLLIVAGLLVHAGHHALHADPGFAFDQVTSIDPGLGAHGYASGSAEAFLGQFTTRLRALPGVTSVALSSSAPLTHERVATITNAVNGHTLPIYPFTVQPEFFTTMGIPLLHGRNLLPHEKNAVLVSESLAHAQWPGEDPVGKKDASGSSANDVVVGVVGNARLLALNDGAAVELYHAVQTADMSNMLVIVKATAPPATLAPAIRSLGTSMDPKLAFDVRPLNTEFKKSMRGVENIAILVSFLGLVAVALAALGMIGLVAYSVSERTKEIAVRIALGAQPSRVVLPILQQFTLPIAVGAVLGLVLTAAVSGMIRQALYGISHLDPLSYAAAMTLLLVITLIAAIIPARRALKVDPIQSLRHE